jgi:hypothetical protein
MRNWFARFLGALVALGLTLPAGAQALPTLEQLEQKLVRGSYLDTLHAAPWAAAQGEAVVPQLAAMLARGQKYDEQWEGATGAYPFNVIWALAQISTPASLQVLEHYFSRTDNEAAGFGIKGVKLRLEQKNRQYGVLLSDKPLLAGASQTARSLRELKAGQAVRILQARVVNAAEEGPRGGPALFDYVEVLPSGPKGYVERAGDGFPPYI